jgi:hypothetical protein
MNSARTHSGFDVLMNMPEAQMSASEARRISEPQPISTFAEQG